MCLTLQLKMGTTPTPSIPPTSITVRGSAIPEQAKGDINDMSDIHAITPKASPTPSMLLPIRAEKRFIPESSSARISLESALNIQNEKNLPSTKDSYVTAANKPFVDYVVIRIPHRGFNSNGVANPALTAEYRFLINPQTAQVSRSTEDAQSFARGGWQYGVWGESLSTISMTGHTPGQYWTYGLTDGYYYFTESWRNLQQLVMFFENNGYFFEGEEANEGPLAPGYTRRRIKKHQDVQLIVGNFVWNGMFQDFGYTLDADHPFRAEFHFSFLSWRERFRPSSPYINSQPSNIQRGHSYGAYTATETPAPPPAGTQNGVPLTTGVNTEGVVSNLINNTNLFKSINPVSPAIQSGTYMDTLNVALFPSSAAVPNAAGNPNMRSLVFGTTGSN